MAEAESGWQEHLPRAGIKPSPRARMMEMEMQRQIWRKTTYWSTPVGRVQMKRIIARADTRTPQQRSDDARNASVRHEWGRER